MNKQKGMYAPINIAKELLPIVKLQALKKGMNLKQYIEHLIQKDIEEVQNE